MSIRNLGSLEVFVALADTQSFTEAAKRMGMTTSAASQALKALEEELAVALISRKSRPVMLTGAGRNLLDGARALLRDARELETAVTASSPILPLLRLGLAESVSCTVGADIVGALFPCTKQLSVRTAMALQLSEQFKNGDFDLLISPVSFPDMDGVMEEAVVAESFFLVTPASNTRSVSTPADLLQLARDLPYFSYTTGGKRQADFRTYSAQCRHLAAAKRLSRVLDNHDGSCRSGTRLGIASAVQYLDGTRFLR